LRSWSRQVLASVLVGSIYEMKNYPVVLVNTVLSPLSFLIIITFVSRGQLIGEAIEGGFIMSMFQSGLSLQADLSHLKNDFKLQDMVVSSPTSPSAYVTGMALAEIIYSIPALAVLAALAAVYIHPGLVQTAQLLGVFLLMFLASVTLGFTLSTFSSDIVQSFAFSRLISTIFSTVTPVYYPITYIPFPYRYAAYLSPTTYAAEITQNSTGFLSISSVEIISAWTVLVAISLALSLLAAKKARWREV
jgi:ABC-2 type transport system permease protein